VEHYEYTPPPQVFSIFGRVATPDIQQYGLRDYGNRVGFWRMAKLLDEFGIRATVSLNMAVLDHYPDVRDAMTSRGWAFMSHGIYNTRALYGFTEEEERAFFQDNVESLRRHTGQDLKGMLGPAMSVTPRTPDLMAAAGLTYTADYFHDDQPVPILTSGGEKFVSVPYSIDLNDGNPGLNSTLSTLATQCKAQFDRLWREGEQSGRVMCLALHPYAIGQPHMIGYLREVLEHVAGHEGVWHTTADEIADYYIANCYEEHVDHARSLAATRAGGAS
jgi:peptidoglycan/xylan/chitin deacetylase (PgdA/CDA1 family)